MEELNGVLGREDEIRTVKWNEIFELEANFISLDISKTSTGWVKKVGTEIQYGTKSFSNLDDVETRHAFKEFIKELFGTVEYNFVCIEDVIGGTNFRTNKILYQLNPIVDDLMYEGIIKSCKVERIDNMQWKRTLRQISGVTTPIKNLESKEEIRLHMEKLGFNITLKQDIIDAVGMAIAVLYRRKVGENTGKKAKLKTDLTKCYKIQEHDNMEICKAYIDKILKKKGNEGREVVTLEYSSRYKDVNSFFKKMITEADKDNAIYIIKAPVGKLGVLGVKKEIGLTKSLDSEVIFTAYLVKKGGK